MSDNALKTPNLRSLNQLATAKAQDQLQLTGKALPCSVVSVRGSIVKVKFEVQSKYALPQVVMPVGFPQYIRLPLQPGDKGLAVPSDFYLGGMSGLGGGVADLTQRANLATLVFFPIGNSGFSSVDGQVLTLYGPNGVTVRDLGSNTVMRVTPAGVYITTPGGGNFTLSGGVISLVNMNIVLTNGDVIADGISLKHHGHIANAIGARTSDSVV